MIVIRKSSPGRKIDSISSPRLFRTSKIAQGRGSGFMFYKSSHFLFIPIHHSFSNVVSNTLRSRECFIILFTISNFWIKMSANAQKPRDGLFTDTNQWKSSLIVLIIPYRHEFINFIIIIRFYNFIRFQFLIRNSSRISTNDEMVATLSLTQF